MTRVSELLGVSTPGTVRKRVRLEQVDVVARPGTTSEESAEVKGLRREVTELKRANAILKAAAFLRSQARPALPLGVDFIRDRADRRERGGLRWGVEPICAVLSEQCLKIAPSTYYERFDPRAVAACMRSTGSRPVRW